MRAPAAPILHHTVVAKPGAHPAACLVVLHGFFGAGRNWTTVARRLAGARADWAVVLADLRLHGASQDLPPPHTVERCADDVVALAHAMEAPVAAVLGHSFGGKVALAYLRRRPAALRQVWLVDADPSASSPEGSAWGMLRAVAGLPRVFRAREDLVAALARSGFDPRTAEWMAANLEQAEGGYRWRLDFAALEALLRDYFRADLWDAVARLPPAVELRVVKATRSHAISDASASRLRAMGGRVFVDEVAGGHWLNADNPDALTALLAAGLPEAAACA